VLGEMSAGIAHEINNPLAIILGHAELLEQYTKNLPPGDPKSASIQASTKSIIATTQRISRIVKALLTFSRRGDAETKEDVSVEAMVDDVLAICQERVKTRGIEIRKRIPKGISIHGNLMQLSQVLLNLVSNALGALEPLELQWIELAATENSQTVEISVTDAGNGIPSEIRDKIMQPFFTTKEVGKGTGLGLSISKGIIDSHHGELVLDEKCPNTRFVITLPKFTATQERKSAA
jgi:C4-dicarboxylate-specific signal transduction histidine kinase